MTNISVIILQKNEALHIMRCLEKLAPLEPRQIFVVDCFSTDGSDKTAAKMGATVVQREWPGNQAAQFNWALDNLKIESGWILRIDADEWLTQELIDEIKARLSSIDKDVDGVVLKRRHYFSGSWVKYGTYPTRILRLFRTGKARYDDRMVMDEHLVVAGNVVEFENDFVDESLIPFSVWQAKHRAYAKREAQMAISGTANANKRKYYKLPPYFRAVLYFCIRYFVKLGFLDGRAGWRWHFWQGLWYRWIVDREIARAKRGGGF